jgi:DUF1680 family protein
VPLTPEPSTRTPKATMDRSRPPALRLELRAPSPCPHPQVGIEGMEEPAAEPRQEGERGTQAIRAAEALERGG